MMKQLRMVPVVCLSILAMVAAGCSGPEPVTEVPVVEVPVTEVPVTEVPVTEVPVTEVPVTEAPVTEAPVTEAPVTEVPVTEVPVTETPVTEVPVTETPEPSSGPTYTNAEHGFSISYPEGWAQTKTGQTEGEVISFVHPAQLPVVVVSLGSVNETTTLTGYGTQKEQDLSQTLVNYELISQGEVTLDDGTPAYELVYKYLFTKFNIFLQSKLLYVIRGTEVFTITGVDMLASFAKDEATLDASIYSFHFE